MPSRIRPLPVLWLTSAPTPMPIASRYRIGCRNEVSMFERQIRRYTAKFHSTMRSGAGVLISDGSAHSTPSLDQRAPGEVQEHVFQRAPPHQRALRLGTVGDRLGQRFVAV